MRSATIRERFLNFFERRGYRILAPAPLVPTDDPSVLFTTAGMQQLKPYFLGTKDAVKDFGSKNLVSVQPCLRTSDIESVGDTSHLTFFEMLGNFSIGGVGREKAITLAWELLTNELGVDPERLWVTYFGGEGKLTADEQTALVWKGILPLDRIRPFPKTNNWWGPAGPSGPCGPSTEIHFDRRGTPCERGPRCLPNCDCDRFVELWNIVFTEYEQSVSGAIKPLRTAGVDTGLGFERLAMILQGKNTIFDTDLFADLVTRLEADANFGREEEPLDTARRRIVADHVKAVTFLLTAGVAFSNKEQGSVLRRLFRRAVDQFLSSRLILEPYVDLIIERYDKTYPLLRERRGTTLAAINQELTVYRQVLELEVSEIVAKIRSKRRTELEERLGVSHELLTPEEAFQIFSTYGISPERMKRSGFRFDLRAFEAQIEKHQQRSRASQQAKFGGHGLGTVNVAEVSPEDRLRITRHHTATHLLHAALRQILGPHVRQQGSDITPERLRFDFEHPKKLAPEERQRIEDLVNEQIRADLPVTVETIPYEEAIRKDALAFFKEKYPEQVTVYSIGTFSKEICGGPHVQRTSELGPFRILTEQSVGTGIRRIKAVVDPPPSAP